MRRVAERYGDAVLLLDATWRVTKYDIPMFHLMVIDNLGRGQVAGMFIVEFETAALIGEALAWFRAQVPQLRPATCMIDKSQAEENALRAQFPDATILLCNFHRLQAWKRYEISLPRLCHRGGCGRPCPVRLLWGGPCS